MKNIDVVEGSSDASWLGKGLGELGLAFRVVGVKLTDEQCAFLVRHVEILRAKIRVDIPSDVSKWLYIEELRDAPDPGGWIGNYRKVIAPYWIPKSDVSLLSELEYLLDEVVRPS